MKDFKVIIAGGRDFDDYNLLVQTFNRVMRTKITTHHVIIVSGAARGADKLGERLARQLQLTVDSFPADWDKHGRAAGPIRNTQMAKHADALIAFWDKKSRGTKNMIDTMRKLDKPYRIVYY